MLTSFSIQSVRLPVFAALLGVALPILASGKSVRADSESCDCDFFQGTSTAVPVTPCTAPDGLCTLGTLVGGFPAAYQFTAATLQSANDPNDPTEYVYTGHSLITAPGGTMTTNDNGVIHIVPGQTTAQFATTILVASGTGRYVGATGTFVDRGVSDLATGTNSGTYIAQVCVPHRRF
jgi:hypothetical protein